MQTLNSQARDPSELLDALVRHWACWNQYEVFYLTKLAPGLVANPNSGDEKERVILSELQGLLSEEEWRDLPRLIAEHRGGILRELDIQRAQKETLEKERQEVRRIAALKREEEERERIRRQERRRREEDIRRSLLRAIRDRLRSDFLSADLFYQESCADVVMQDDFTKEKLSFVRSWIAENTPKEKDEKNSVPDDEQIAAIAAVHGNIQVVARAGSGKTSTLVNRTLFLMKHCRVDPAEILILAFNRKAALEVRKRLLTRLDEAAEAHLEADADRRRREQVKRGRNFQDEIQIESSAVDTVAADLGVALPHVMTFHALAYAIVHPENLLVDSSDETLSLSSAFQQVVDDHLHDVEFEEQIRKLMLAHFREDWEHIVQGRYDQDREELLRYRRSLPRESIGGDYVKSYGEKLIADFLFEHDIPYKYERNHWWNRVNYRPDFTIFTSEQRGKESGIIIEYFGLAGDSDYDEMSNEKRIYWAKRAHWRLIEFGPIDVASCNEAEFCEQMGKRLAEVGLSCTRLSEDEIWHRVRDRAIDRFTKSSVSFVGRCRQLSLSPEELKERIDVYTPLSDVEAMFLGVLQPLYAAYLGRLSATGDDDFNGLMQRAADVVRSGETEFRRKSSSGEFTVLRYICIDEFQDFTPSYFRLLSAIRERNGMAELFCVGDDWQAINGFAGSDLRFYENFPEYFGESRRMYISTNYRSSTAVVAIGNLLMDGLGKPANPHKRSAGGVFLTDLNEFEPSITEKEQHRGDLITPAVSRLVSRMISDGKKVAILCRRNGLPWYISLRGEARRDGRDHWRFLDTVRSILPGNDEKINISTVHKYKGLDEAVVIIPDAVARSYPLIHPDWVFSRILGETPETIVAEERRLFYVALTRAVDTLIIITDGRNRSPFLDELEHTIDPVDWADFPCPPSDTARLVVKIGNLEFRGSSPTHAIRDLLKAAGYRWQSTGWPAWAKSLPADVFRFEVLKQEVWWGQVIDGIEVRVYDQSEVLISRHIFDRGEWRPIREAPARPAEPFAERT